MIFLLFLPLMFVLWVVFAASTAWPLLLVVAAIAVIWKLATR